VFESDLSNKTPLRFLAAGYASPHTVKRLGRARLTRFFYRHSRGRWGEPHAEALLVAATETLGLWADDLDFDELVEDIAIEARLALRLGEELKDLDERIAIFLAQADPQGIITSVPGSVPSWGRRFWGVWGIPTASEPSRGSVRSVGSSPRSTSRAPRVATVVPPSVGTPACARRCSWRRIKPGGPIPPSQLAITA
jgi:hypothetical protein